MMTPYPQLPIVFFLLGLTILKLSGIKAAIISLALALGKVSCAHSLRGSDSESNEPKCRIGSLHRDGTLHARSLHRFIDGSLPSRTVHWVFVLHGWLGGI